MTAPPPEERRQALPAPPPEPLLIDQAGRRASWQGQPLDLTPTEFDALACLVRRDGQPVPYDELLQAVWGVSLAEGGSLPQVRSTVVRLRKKLAAVAGHSCRIENVRGTGYRFVPPSNVHPRGPRQLLLARALRWLALVGLVLALGWLLWKQIPGDPWAPAWYRGRRVPVGMLHVSGRGSFCAFGPEDRLYCFDTEEERAAAYGLPLPGVDPERLEELRESGAVPDLRPE